LDARPLRGVAGRRARSGRAARRGGRVKRRLLLLALLASGCGGTSATTVTAVSTATVTVTVTSPEAPAPAPTTDTSASASDRPSPVRVENTAIIYEPDQVGGHYHTAVALVRNTSDRAISIDGQFSFEDDSGNLIGTADVSLDRLEGGAEGALIADGVDLPKPLRKGHLQVILDTGAPSDGPAHVQFGRPHYVASSGFGTCALRVTATSPSKQSLVDVILVGLEGGRIVTAGNDYPDFLPNAAKVIDITMVSPALCPKGGPDQLLVFATS
jgi:hypothetical protein